MKKNKPNPQFFAQCQPQLLQLQRLGYVMEVPEGRRGLSQCLAGPHHSSLLSAGGLQAGPCPQFQLLPTHTPKPSREGGLISQSYPMVFLPFRVILRAAFGLGQWSLSYAPLGNEGVIAISILYLQHLLRHFQTHTVALGAGGDLNISAHLAVCYGSKGKGVLGKSACRDRKTIGRAGRQGKKESSS